MSRRALLVLLSLLATPAMVAAQRTRIQLTGFPITFTAPTGADFDAGFIQAATAGTFTVEARQGPETRTTIVSIRCSAPCPSTGTKALSTLQWRRSDLGTWNTLTTTDTQVEQRVIVPNGSNDPWTNSIQWRFLLSWMGDPPSATANFNIIFTLTVTVP